MFYFNKLILPTLWCTKHALHKFHLYFASFQPIWRTGTSSEVSNCPAKLIPNLYHGKMNASFTWKPTAKMSKELTSDHQFERFKWKRKNILLKFNASKLLCNFIFPKQASSALTFMDHFFLPHCPFLSICLFSCLH